MKRYTASLTLLALTALPILFAAPAVAMPAEAPTAATSTATSTRRRTGGVRSHRFLRGEDELMVAWVGVAPPRALREGGKKILEDVGEPASGKGSNVIDLMAALKKSIGDGGGKPQAGPRAAGAQAEGVLVAAAGRGSSWPRSQHRQPLVRRWASRCARCGVR